MMFYTLNWFDSKCLFYGLTVASLSSPRLSLSSAILSSLSTLRTIISLHLCFFIMHCRRLMLDLFSFVKCRLNMVFMSISIRILGIMLFLRNVIAYYATLFSCEIKCNLYLLTSYCILEHNFLETESISPKSVKSSKLVLLYRLCSSTKHINVFSLINYYWK